MFRKRPFRQSAQHQMTKTSFDNGLTNKGISFVIAARHAAALTEPAETALHHPAPRQCDETFGAGRHPDHLHPQTQRRGGRGHQRPLVAGIGPEQLQLRGDGLGLGQYRGRAHGVLHAGRLHQHGQGQSLGIDDYRALTASHLLTRIVAVTAPLFEPVRTDCESMAPAVGSASRVSWRTC